MMIIRSGYNFDFYPYLGKHNMKTRKKRGQRLLCPRNMELGTLHQKFKCHQIHSLKPHWMKRNFNLIFQQKSFRSLTKFGKYERNVLKTYKNSFYQICF